MKRPDVTPLVRGLLVSAGVLALCLAVLGVLLPGLPTTPFVLLAAACFAKASPRLHHWLLNQRHLGPMVRDWEAHRSLPVRIKWLSTSVMTAMVCLSAWQMAHKPWVASGLLLLGALGAWVVWRCIPTRHPAANNPPLQPHHTRADTAPPG